MKKVLLISELIITIFFLCACQNSIDNKKNTTIKNTSESLTSTSQLSLTKEKKEDILAIINKLKENLKIQENYYTNTEGVVTTYALIMTHKQKIKSKVIKNGQLLFKESISTSSLKQVAEQMIIDEGICYIRTGKIVSDTVYWDEEYLIKNFESYLNEYGTNPYDFISYEINLDSITEFKLKENEIILILDPIKSTKNYAKEIKRMANANTYPIFSKVEITIIYNDEYLIQKVLINEAYELDFPILNLLNIKNEMEINYFYEKKSIDDFRYKKAIK